ncbi:flagellar hook-length control protein FliK [Granulosicoccus sp.]|nr:flagellar hook-length control protein FliK [Granulosicoccus sp.]MDB4224378.1 flagellar hook-length control protein FliK [Granulosicoccus sp.]
MPETTTNIFSMAPPVSVKTTDSFSEKSTFSGDSTSKDQSSFSSKLSHAEDRQRSGLADSDRAEKTPRPVSKEGRSSDADEPGETGIAKSTEDSTGSVVGKRKASDTVSADSVKSVAPPKDAAALEALAGVAVGLHGDESIKGVLTAEIALEAADRSNVDKSLELGLLVNSSDGVSTDEAIGGNNLSKDTAVPTALVNTLTETNLKGAAESEKTIPIAGLATGAITVEPDKAAATLSTDSGLLSTGRNSALPSGPLTQGVSAPLTSVPVVEGEATATLPAVDKRLGRLSSTIEPFESTETEPAFTLADTKNSKNIDASVMGLRNKALGLNGEHVVNQSIQQPGSTAIKSERSTGILISDLALPNEASLTPRAPQATGAQPGELSPAQLVTQLNQATGQAETIPAASLGLNNDLPKGLSGAAAIDHMLAATTSGIVTAPTQGRVDLANSQIVNAPLNVPLLASSASEVLSGNIRWMVGEGIQTATVSVTPSGMGPITVQIGVEKEQMSISIVATQGSTREALEASIPRLREQLGTQGLESVRVDISDGRSDQSKSNTSSDRQAMGGNTENSQDSNAENSNNENSSASFGNSNEQDSGERVLSDIERDLLSQLQDLSTDPSVAQSTIRHGYDLYV